MNKKSIDNIKTTIKETEGLDQQIAKLMIDLLDIELSQADEQEKTTAMRKFIKVSMKGDESVDPN
jgi:hypothetical protein